METVKEFHIAIRQALQKVASNQSRNFLDDEIDWALNINQERYIKSKFKKTEQGTGYAIDDKSLQDIAEIQVLDYEISTIKNNSESGYVVFPANYSQLINDRSRIYTNCNVDFTLNTTTNTEYIGYAFFPNSTKTSLFYDTFNITLNNTVLFDNSIYSKTYLSPLEKFFLINLVQEDVNRVGDIKIYWESYKAIYRPNYFIIVSQTAFTGNLTVDSSITTSFTSISSVYETYLNKVERTIPNRLTNSAWFSQVMNDPYAKSNPDSIVSRISGNNLYVYFDPTLLITKVVIDYIRKPRQISLSLNRMCELNDSTHQEIVENTVQYLMLVTENPTYQIKQSDNKINLE